MEALHFIACGIAISYNLPSLVQGLPLSTKEVPFVRLDSADRMLSGDNHQRIDAHIS